MLFAFQSDLEISQILVGLKESNTCHSNECSVCVGAETMPVGLANLL